MPNRTCNDTTARYTVAGMMNIAFFLLWIMLRICIYVFEYLYHYLYCKDDESTLILASSNHCCTAQSFLKVKKRAAGHLGKPSIVKKKIFCEIIS